MKKRPNLGRPYVRMSPTPRKPGAWTLTEFTRKKTRLCHRGRDRSHNDHDDEACGQVRHVVSLLDRGRAGAAGGSTVRDSASALARLKLVTQPAMDSVAGRSKSVREEYL